MDSPVLRRTLILLVVAVAARALTFGNPIIHVDEEFYLLTAHAMLDGAAPFVDIWDRKPIGLFLLYLPAALFGYPGGIWAYQMLALAFVVATALVVARLAERAGWSRGATFAGILYILWLNLADGQGGQAPIFYNLPMALAALLIAPGPADDDRGARWRRGLAAMALVGVALQIKYAAVFEGAFFGLWWVWRETRLKEPVARTLVRAVPLGLAAFVPTIAAWGWYAAHGHGDAFVYANFTSILSRGSNVPIETLRNLKNMAFIMVPILIMAWGSRRETKMAVFIGAWLLAALAALAVFGSWFNHYALPVILPAATCAGGWLGANRKRALTVLVLSFLAGQALLTKQYFRRGNANDFGALSAAVGHGPGSLYVYSGAPMLYLSTGRPWLSRYVFSTHLNLAREEGAIGVDQRAEVERILALRPQVLVVGGAHRNERPDLRVIVEAAARAHYRKTADLSLGIDPTVVYVLQER